MNYTFIRKRLIPAEEVDISSDELLRCDGNVIVTRWLPIKPRNDIGWGVSLTDIAGGYKISAVHDVDGLFKYWYVDIIETQYFPEERKYVFTDLLVDVRIYPGAEPVILDLDELEYARKRGMLSEIDYKTALFVVDYVITLYQTGGFPDLTVIQAPKGFKSRLENCLKKGSSLSTIICTPPIESDSMLRGTSGS